MVKIIQMKPSKSMRSSSDIKAMRQAILNGPATTNLNKALNNIRPYGVINDPLES